MASPRLRLLFAFLLGLLLFASLARAHEGHDHDHDSDDADDQEAQPVAAETKAALEEVLFKPTSIEAPFLEQFTSDWESRWTVSQAKKVIDGVEDEELLRFRGVWSVEEPTVLPGIKGDAGLVAKTAAAHHAIAAKFRAPVNPKGKSLVVQYEVKLQSGLECGGAYMKLLKDTKAFDPTKFDDKQPYVIMFGPDRCGSTNKVHFIFKHKSPKTGAYEEKHLTNPPLAKTEKLSTLYTLIVNPDNTFEILINNESSTKGNLLEDFTPAVNPPKEIDDPDDKKPSDWVDEAEIADPDAKKPDDWDETAPEFIPDPEAEKPEDWQDDEPATIPDPEAVMPEDWDEEEDGEWVAPSIANPKCENGNCGVWKRPQIKNPAFKGKWTAPKIPNPAYKGVWAPRKVANPNFFEDKHPANFEPIGAIGFEIWTMQDKILFDNIYVGHSVEDAKKLAEETWAVKYKLEKAQEDAAAPPKPDADKKEGKKWTDAVTDAFKSFDVDSFVAGLKAFAADFQKDPVKSVENNPTVAIALVVVLGTVLLLAAIATSLGGETPKPVAPKAKKEKKEAEKSDGGASSEEKPEAAKEGPKKRAAPRKDDQ